MSFEDFETDLDVADGAVTVEREKIIYEIPEPGSYKAECVEVELKERSGKNGAYVVVQSIWELSGEGSSYVVNEEKKQFRVWDSFGLAYGPAAKLHKAFLALTGEVPDTLVTKEDFTKGDKKMERITFPHECFLGMKAEVAIVHTKADNGNTYANIGSYMCKDAMKKVNADLCFEA